MKKIPQCEANINMELFNETFKNREPSLSLKDLNNAHETRNDKNSKSC